MTLFYFPFKNFEMGLKGQMFSRTYLFEMQPLRKSVKAY